MRAAGDGVDLEPPGEIGGLPEELLVPPVPDPPDSLGDEQARCEAVGEQPHVAPARFAIKPPTRHPAAIPPHTPRPPFQIAKGPHHWSGTSFQLVAR